MNNNILEISQRTSKGGRVPIKIALLKIHEDLAETNKNGLHWNEEYVTNAMNSAKLMPICAELCDDRATPIGHGMTGTIVNEDGIQEPVFENSETVGVIEDVSIETITKDDSEIKVLCGSGYLYSQRYPGFVKWVRTNYALGQVDTSIEITGLPENQNQIVYADKNPSEQYRTPKDFLFTGTAIMSIAPADDDAIVVEVAQKINKKEDKTNMEFDMNEIKSLIQNTISECNNKEDSFTAQITELNEQIAAKDAVIAEKDNKIVELNASVEQVQKALDDLKKEHETYWSEREALEKELGELKAKARLGELNSAISSFSDEERKYAEVEINSFNENPMEGDIDGIVSKIYAGIGQASKKAMEDARIAEQNSKKETDVVDIFSEICAEAQSDSEDDIDIFN